MSGFFITNHYPNINEHDIPRNPTIKVYFSEEFLVSSINYKVISVHDSSYNNIVGTTLYDYSSKGTSSGVLDVLTFAPTVTLSPNSKYNVYVYGSPSSLVSKHNEGLPDTYIFSFYTGSGILTITTPDSYQQLQIDLQGAIDARDWSLAKELQSQLDNFASGVVPSGIQTVPDIINHMIVNYIYPTNETTNVNLSKLNFIKIGFNDIPSMSGYALGDYFTVSHTDVILE